MDSRAPTIGSCSHSLWPNSEHCCVGRLPSDDSSSTLSASPAHAQSNPLSLSSASRLTILAPAATTSSSQPLTNTHKLFATCHRAPRLCSSSSCSCSHSHSSRRRRRCRTRSRSRRRWWKTEQSIETAHLQQRTWIRCQRHLSESARESRCTSCRCCSCSAAVMPALATTHNTTMQRCHCSLRLSLSSIQVICELVRATM